MSSALATESGVLAGDRLLAQVGAGTMDPVAYDTAWLARLTRRGDPGRALFPECAAWLLRAQRPDGSWGAERETLHDRVAATLAAMVALETLLRHEARLPEPPAAVRRRLAEARAYLRARGPALIHDPWETVGFELAVPVLLVQARSLGLELPWEAFAFVAQRRAAKLAGLPRGWQGAVGAAMVHTLEGWGCEGDPHLPGLRGANGSCANSPSATAFYYAHIPDETARAYLQECCRRGGGGVADVFPFDVFEAAWVLDHLQTGDVPTSAAARAPLVASLLAAWGDGARGVGIAASGLEPDADDTALTALVLQREGRAVGCAPLAAFRRPGGFACFPFERNPSVSANIHAAYALWATGEEAAADLAPVRAYLADARRPEGCWTDKWHVSAWYPTCRAVLGLSELWPDLVAPAVEWLLDGQHPEGSWGTGVGTAEETAYAVQALSRVRGHRRNDARRAMAAAAAILHEEPAAARPALWVGKGLYHPRRVVDAAVLAARQLCSALEGGAR